MKLLQLNSLLWAVGLILAATTSPALAQGIDYQLGVGHDTGDSVGLDDGFTRFETWVPLSQPTPNTVLFGDLRFLLFNDQSEAVGANVGLGGRWYDSLANRIWGGYAYYDYRDTGPTDYDQISFGLESLGHLWDWRINGHIPFGYEQSLLPGGQVEAIYEGQNLLLTNLTRETALRGVHGEVARLLIDQGHYQVRGAVGAYGFTDRDSDIEAIGPRARVEFRGGDEFWLSAYIQHDDHFDTTGGVSFVWRFGVTGSGAGYSSSGGYVASRLGDPVERLQHVVISQSAAGGDAGLLATNSDGSPITIRHVDSTAAGGGDGSFENPNNTLADASNQSENIIFIHGGSSFSGESFTTGTAGQRVLGGGCGPHRLHPAGWGDPAPLGLGSQSDRRKLGRQRLHDQCQRS